MPHTNFEVEIAVDHASDNLGPMDSRTIIARFVTNSVLELSEYLSDAQVYFSGMVQFDSNVTYVAILVRTYQDHHVIHISRDANGKLKITSNQ